MANMSLEKIKMPEQAPDVRNKNFKEGFPRLYRGNGNRRSAEMPEL